MSLFPWTIDGKPQTCPQLASQLGLSESRVTLAIKEFKPTTMAELKEAIRRQLSRPRPKFRPQHVSKVWNSTGYRTPKANP